MRSLRGDLALAELLGFTGTDSEKLDTLWSEIFTLCRLENVADEETLPKHLERLGHRTKAMNDYHLKTTLHYTLLQRHRLTY